ncbi:MAG TPA: RodZ domain-containing protein [Rhodanobacteraceae bacterium]|jgi:cytoskeleton protein RodZ|nr:RodZ domain-containing protein [Rhodanobacteraceae bacterium]
MTESNDSRDLFAATPQQDETVTVVQPSDAPAPSLGQRLRTAREGRELSIAECARQLHLPAQVLQRLEADDPGSPEHFVFLRGALQGYVRFLGLPVGICDPALRSVAPAAGPQLVSVAHTSTPRWLMQRYGTAATYIVLTAFIAVPLVLLGLRGGLDRPAARVVSLDQASTLAESHAQHQPATAPATKAAATESPDSAPFRASLTPFAAIGLRDIDAASTAAATAATTPPAISGQHTLTVTASDDCWFQITGADGQKVDSGMLRAGDVRTWHSAGVLHVTFGNADGVAVTEDGRPVDLAPFRHANVARLDPFGPATGDAEND